jgi:hypothetical protein
MGSKIVNFNKKYKNLIEELDNVNDINCKIDVLEQFIKFDLNSQKIQEEIGALRLFLYPKMLFMYFLLENSTPDNLNIALTQIICTITNLKRDNNIPEFLIIFLNARNEFKTNVNTIKLGFELFEISEYLQLSNAGSLNLFFSYDFDKTVSILFMNFIKSFRINSYFGSISDNFNTYKNLVNKKRLIHASKERKIPLLN